MNCIDRSLQKSRVSRMTFYRHFKNKEEVVLEYFELIYDKFLKELLELESINSLILSEKLVGLFVEQEEEIEKCQGELFLVFGICSKDDYFL
ncbi:TetR/AcrR family transcriptional regulator [Lactococcus cremoris]